MDPTSDLKHEIVVGLLFFYLCQSKFKLETYGSTYYRIELHVPTTKKRIYR